VGGPLVDLVGWRLIFVLQAGLALIALLLAMVILPESEPKRVRFDVARRRGPHRHRGLSHGRHRPDGEWGIDHPAIVASLVLFPFAAWAFVSIERRSDHPLVPLEFLGRRNFTFTLLTSLFLGSVYMGGFVLAPIALREGFGLTATVTAAVMLLRTGVYSLSSPLGGQMGARLGTRPTALDRHRPAGGVDGRLRVEQLPGPAAGVLSGVARPGSRQRHGPPAGHRGAGQLGTRVRSGSGHRAATHDLPDR
jgi:MFS family permease